MRKLQSVLFHVSPFHSHGVPLGLAVGAVDKLMAMAKVLKAGGVRVEVFTSDAAAGVMRADRSDVFKDCDRVHAWPEKVFADVGGGAMERAAQVHHGQSSCSIKLSTLRRDWEQRGVGDRYDIVISFFAETSFLKQVFRSSRVLFFETGLVCHLPFQQFHSFDPFGTLLEGSYIGRRSEADLASEENLLEEYRPILEQIRQGIGAFSARYYKSLTDLHGLRAKWKRIYLIAGQPMGRSSDRELFPISFDFVEHVLRCVPPESAVLVTEHPNFPQLTGPQHHHLKGTFPNYVYSSALQAIYSPAAVCLPLADAVVGLSSTVLLHSHALGLKTFALGSSCLAALNADPSLEEFVHSVESNAYPANRDLQILDLIAHYSVPMAMYQSPWLCRYLTEILNAPANRLPKIAPAEDLLAHYKPRTFPGQLAKPLDYFQTQWSSAPLSLAELRTTQPTESTRPRVQAAKTTVATILDHYAIGGTQAVVRRLIEFLPDVHWVIFLEKRVSEEFPIAPNCELIEIGSLGDAEVEPERKLARAVFEFNKTARIDVFINPMHWRAASLRAMPLIKEIVGIPVVYWEHNSFFFPMYIGRPDLHDLRRQVVEQVDRVVLLSDYDRWHFASHYPASHHQVIHNPVPQIEAAQHLNLEKDKTVLIVGRFDPQKRMDRIPEIAESFLSKHPDWSFTILGGGHLRSSVESAVAKTTVADRVRFAGYQPNAAAFFKNAAIFASLSDYEGDPLTLMEAKANGLPIVAFELFQNTRLRDGVDGFYLRQDDREGFVTKLSELADNTQLRRAMATKGHQHFLSFRNELVAQSWSDLFDALTKNAPFTPSPVEAPDPEVLQREAVHVAQAVHRLMNEKLRRAQSRAATERTPAPKSAPSLKSKTPDKSADLKTRPTPASRPEFNLSRTLTAASDCMRRGRYNEAVDHYQKCVNSVPDNANLKRLFAEALLSAGRRSAALDQLELARNLKPENRQLRRRLRKVAHPLLFFWASNRPFTG